MLAFLKTPDATGKRARSDHVTFFRCVRCLSLAGTPLHVAVALRFRSSRIVASDGQPTLWFDPLTFTVIACRQQLVDISGEKHQDAVAFPKIREGFWPEQFIFMVDDVITFQGIQLRRRGFSSYIQ